MEIRPLHAWQWCANLISNDQCLEFRLRCIFLAINLAKSLTLNMKCEKLDFIILFLGFCIICLSKLHLASVVGCPSSGGHLLGYTSVYNNFIILSYKPHIFQNRQIATFSESLENGLWSWTLCMIHYSLFYIHFTIY